MSPTVLVTTSECTHLHDGFTLTACSSPFRLGHNSTAAVKRVLSRFNLSTDQEVGIILSRTRSKRVLTKFRSRSRLLGRPRYRLDVPLASSRFWQTMSSSLSRPRARTSRLSFSTRKANQAVLNCPRFSRITRHLFS